MFGCCSYVESLRPLQVRREELSRTSCLSFVSWLQFYFVNEEIAPQTGLQARKLGLPAFRLWLKAQTNCSIDLQDDICTCLL